MADEAKESQASQTDSASDTTVSNQSSQATDEQSSTQSAADVKTEDGKKKKKDKKEDLDSTSIQVKVYSAYQTYYDAPAKSVSAENDTGPFDILPRHHNFITLVNAGEVIIRPVEGEDKKLRITRGVMHVRRNKVTLFLDV